MSRNIAERDWKVFAELHSVALERFCTRILAEVEAKLQRSSEPSYDKFAALHKLLNTRDQELRRAFSDYRRSTALIQIATINSMGLFTDEELRRFSPETVDFLQIFKKAP